MRCSTSITTQSIVSVVENYTRIQWFPLQSDAINKGDGRLGDSRNTGSTGALAARTLTLTGRCSAKSIDCDRQKSFAHYLRVDAADK